ncbi:hypothetical protein Tco_1392965 [Tanacetum coccineum]
MSTQQDIYAAGSENRPPMLNKDNYVPWSSCLLRYAKSKPKRKLIYKSITKGLYVRRMIPEQGDPDRDVPVPETFHEQTDDELTKQELKQVVADDQAIQTILMGLPEDIYAAVDSCETAQEICQQSQVPQQSSTIMEMAYHYSSSEKDLHEVDYAQLYDFLKMNQEEVNKLRAERLVKRHDPLALMADSHNLYNYPMFHSDQSSPLTYMQQPQPNNNYAPQLSFNTNYM